MSVAEGYSISVQCDGMHQPGLTPMNEVYGVTKRQAHTELKRQGWRLGSNFTAYCPKCKPPTSESKVSRVRCSATNLRGGNCGCVFGQCKKGNIL